MGAKIVFYRVTTAHLPIYIDMGLHLVKLGEEAKINLADFHTQGAARASMRNLLNKMPATAGSLKSYLQKNLAQSGRRLPLFQSLVDRKNAKEKKVFPRPL